MNNKDQPEDLIGKWPYPIDFLEDYMKFAINARVMLIKLIVDRHANTDEIDEKKLLLQLGREQFFLMLETLLAFYGAETSDGEIDLYSWLTRDFSELNLNVRYLDEKRLEKIYKSAMPELDADRLEQFVKNAVEIAKYMKKLSPLTERFIPFFNKSKHKFLYFRYKDDICMLTSEQAEKELLEIAQTESSGPARENQISWLVKCAEQARMLIENAIYMIILRLQTEGTNRWISGPGENAELFNLHIQLP